MNGHADNITVRISDEGEFTINNLLDYYRYKLSSKHLVFQYINGRWIFFTTFAFLNPFALASAIFLYALRLREIATYDFIAFGGTLLIALFMFYNVNSAAKRIVQQRYGIGPNGFMWNGSRYWRYRRLKLRDYLKHQGYLEKNKLDVIVTSLERLAENQKWHAGWSYGAIAALLLPVWVFTIQKVLGLAQTGQEFIILVLLIIVFALLMIALISMIRVIQREIANREYEVTTSLIRQLNEIRLTID